MFGVVVTSFGQSGVAVMQRPSHLLVLATAVKWLAGILILAALMFVGPAAALAQKAGLGRAPAAYPFPDSPKAPPLEGGTGWINSAGPIDLSDLHGKFVVLDFWTYCCINCMHVLPELKKLEQAFPKNVVVIGVHSAKFFTETDSKNIAEA